MSGKWLFLILVFLCPGFVLNAQNIENKKITLQNISLLIEKNREIIIENVNRRIAEENLEQQKDTRLPELMLGGDGYLSNRIPLAGGHSGDNSFLYHFNLSSEMDIYTGGKHSHAIERMAKEEELSGEKLKFVRQEVKLKAYVLLYDIYRNIKYRDFVLSSIHLREKEYERIEQLYKNGVVLKSDLLRSKLYITDLQKDEVAISNSIDILSDQLCVALGMDERYRIVPDLGKDLEYKVTESFNELFQYALSHSPLLKMHRKQTEYEEIALKELGALKRPDLKVYARYGVGSAPATFDYDHQLGGEVGLRLSVPLSALYKTRSLQSAQKYRIEQEQTVYTDEEEHLKNSLYELYTRYHESLLNIERAIEKCDMSKESNRILTNSYFNQQALLIDVLESETQSMEASFEWVEAIVDSQKYYWALKQICGFL